MTKEKRLLNLNLILAILGFALIIFSGSIGESLSNLWLRQNGGTADTEIFLFMMHSFRNSALLIGGIFFAICLPTTIYAWYQSLDKPE